MSKKLSGTQKFLAGASVLAAATAMMGVGTAYAQDNSASNASSGDEEIVVTGTRIARPGFTSTSPIATVGADEVQRQQTVNIEELLRNQPQFLQSDGSQVNNGSAGVATLNLRGLAPNRTLVLMDGTRLPGYDPNNLVDVSAIPLGLLSRVDVVTGGASAVYGSDAVAGVVNFIMNDNFQGIDVRASHAWNDLHSSGDTENIQLTMGAGFDQGRGNVALALTWMDRQPVYQIKGPAALAPGASSTTTPSAFDTTGGRTQVNASGNLVPFFQGFDFNGQNLYQQPQTRWGATAIGHYDINDHITAYTRFIYNNSYAAPQLASSGTFGFSFDIPANNPFLSAPFLTYLSTHAPVTEPCPAPGTGTCYKVGVRWRAVDVGPRQYAFQYNTFQSQVGFRGDIGDTNWRWDLVYAYGQTNLDRQQNNDIDSGRVQQSFFATSTTTCADPSNFCAPLNIFNPSLGPPSAASLDFIRLNLQVQARSTQEYGIGTLTGDLGKFQSPWANSPIGTSFGFEYRRVQSGYLPDAASQAGTSPGFGQTLPVHGHYDTMEYFGEMLIPLVEDAPFARSINAELGYRTSDYSISGHVESYKYGADWTPADGFRLRGMFQRAVRAPNVNELFGPFTPGTGDLKVDPCSGVTFVGNPTLFTLCQNTGVPNPAVLAEPTSGQVNNFAGGNTNLVPETADTTTFGLVFRPSFMHGFTATIDYYNIEINNAISVRPIFDIVGGCYDLTRNPTANPLAPDCTLILRNTLDGSMEGDTVFGVNQRTQNIGSVKVQGIDYSLDYQFDLGDLGTLDANLEGTHLTKTEYTPSSGLTIDCIGGYGKVCGLPDVTTASVGGPVPEDHFVQRTTWSMGPWEVSYRWRHISGVKEDAQDVHDDLIAGTFRADSATIKAFNYVDLDAAWQVNDNFRVNFAVTNIFDKDAPFVFTGTGSTPENSGNTYPSMYDVLGRVFTVGLQAKF